jgi:hypothetical protein
MVDIKVDLPPRENKMLICSKISCRNMVVTWGGKGVEERYPK